MKDVEMGIDNGFPVLAFCSMSFLFFLLGNLEVLLRRVIWDEDPGFLRFVLLRESVAEGPWLSAATAASFEELPEERNAGFLMVSEGFRRFH